MIETNFILSENDDNKFDVVQEKWEIISILDNESRFTKMISQEIMATFDSYIEAKTFIYKQKKHGINL